jgi:hypothetical protein
LFFGLNDRNQTTAWDRGRISEGMNKARPIKRAVRHTHQSEVSVYQFELKPSSQ